MSGRSTADTQSSRTYSARSREDDDTELQHRAKRRRLDVLDFSDCIKVVVESPYSRTQVTFHIPVAAITVDSKVLHGKIDEAMTTQATRTISLDDVEEESFNEYVKYLLTQELVIVQHGTLQKKYRRLRLLWNVGSSLQDDRFTSLVDAQIKQLASAEGPPPGYELQYVVDAGMGPASCLRDLYLEIYATSTFSHEQAQTICDQLGPEALRELCRTLMTSKTPVETQQ